MGGRGFRVGSVLRRWMVRRLGQAETEQLISDLGELFDARLEREGPGAADRWWRRERRRWIVRLATGSGLSRGPGGPLPPRESPTRVRDARTEVARSLRTLARSPLLALAIVCTVGLGIGGTTLVWATVHAVLIAPLPYPDAERLVLLRTVRGQDRWGTSMADLEAVYDPPPAFEAVAGYSRGAVSVMLGGEAQLLESKWITDSYLPLIGATPILGRGFTPEEGRAGGADVVLLSQRVWERSFDADPEVIGRALNLDGVPHTVVGVLPRSLGPLDDADLYPALRVRTPGRKGPFFYPTIARLAPGVSEAEASAQLVDVSRRMFPIWRSSFPSEDAVLGFEPLKEAIVGDVGRTLYLVLAATGFLFLVAAANAAGLLVARGIGRRRELAVRVAVGASRGRILRLVLLESAILGAVSGLLGLGLAGSGLGLLQRLGADRLARVDEIAFTAPVALFFAVVTVASCMLLGVISSGAVLRFGGIGGGTRLAGSSRRSTGSPGARRLRRVLVASQFAVAIPLLVSAGLLGRSLDRLRSENVGFDVDRIVSMQVALPEGSYPTDESIRRYWAEVLPDLDRIPGVAAVGVADARPPVVHSGENNFVLEGQPSGTDAPQTQSPWIMASHGFFDVLGSRLIDGRLYGPTTDTMRHAVVDQAWADRYLPGGGAVGRRFRSGGCTIDGCPFTEIVGVVETVKTTGLDDMGRGTIFYDFEREPYGGMFLHLRTQDAPLEVVAAAREVLRRRDPSVPVADIRTAAQVASDSMIGRRTTSLLVSLLAAVALLLSVVGIYGAMATFVRQSVRDTGIRLALGAAPSRALRGVVGDGLRVAVVGVLAGAVFASVSSRYLEGLLYDVTPSDPLVFSTVCGITLVVAVVATAIPGMRAATTDPAVTLRED